MRLIYPPLRPQCKRFFRRACPLARPARDREQAKFDCRNEPECRICSAKRNFKQNPIVNAAPRPANEAERLKALRAYDVLDTPAEEAFDDLTRLAAQVCNAPIALVCLVDEERQWFKSKVGLEISETPRDLSFCAHAVCQPDLFV